MILSSTAWGADKPNFSGDWKLNSEKSDLGQMPAPSSWTQKITHAEPKLTVLTKMASDRGEFEFELNYTTDGKESTNTIRSRSSVSVVKWEGDALSFDTKSKMGDNEFTMKDKWTTDGKVLTIQRHWASSMGEGDQKLIFEKQ